MLRAVLLGVLGVVLLASRSAAADDVVVTPSSGGQASIGARVLGGWVAYRVCTQAPCVPTTTDGAVALPVGTEPSSVHLESLTIGPGRYVLYAYAPAWSALIGAAPGASAPRVLWSGATGWVEGEDGERHGGRVEVTEPDGGGAVQVLVGEVQEDVSICGRPTILSPRLLDSRDLTFKAVTVQRLRRDERDRAPKLEALPSTAPAPPPSTPVDSPVESPRILQAAAASSGVGSPAALTDGDPETTWSEKRGGDGRGEFVRMNAPEQVEITSISFVARPAARALPKGAGPRKIWLATPDALFAVTFRGDPWARPGAAYSVKLPAPIRTSCLAIVLDEAYSKSSAADVDVTLAEVTAHTEFDDNPDPAKLAGALAGGQARARMAAALLVRAGSAGHAAAASAYPTLDDAGRLLALEVIDGAPCPESAPIYLTAMQIGRPGEVHHAADRLMRCGREAAPALSAALASGTVKQKVEAAKLLSLVAPEAAVTSIVKLLPTARPELRSELRAALARASQSPAGQKASAAALSDAALPKVAAIDLLRAAASEPVAMPEASARLGQLLVDRPDFRTRYLLLAPAAALAEGGDSNSESFVLRALSADESEHVRARAAEVAGALMRAVGPLAKALGDADARVRAAALVSISRLTDPRGRKVQSEVWPPDLFSAVAKLLGADPFTFVRAHAAEALLGAPAGAAGDGPLVQALSDESPVIRGRAVDVLGARGAKSHAGDVSARLDDEAETLDVRARAARALGQMCDMASLDHLSELVHAAAGEGANPASRVIAASAAEALGRLAPPDLAKRLAPLTDANAPRVAQEIAKSALSSTDRCPKSAQ